MVNTYPLSHDINLLECPASLIFIGFRSLCLMTFPLVPPTVSRENASAQQGGAGRRNRSGAGPHAWAVPAGAFGTLHHGNQMTCKSSVRLGVIWRSSEGVWPTGTLLQRAPELLTRQLVRESP